MLPSDPYRCHDSGCPERETCLRWIERKEPIDNQNQMASLFPYDIPIGDPCPMKLEK